MFGALLLFEDEFIHVVSISFTALILTELIMVALTIRTWHWLMIIAEFLSLAIYILSVVILKDYFGENLLLFSLWQKIGTIYVIDILYLSMIYLIKNLILCKYVGSAHKMHIWLLSEFLFVWFSDAEFLKTGDFMWKTATITAISCVPLYVWKFLRKRFSPTSYQKLS